MSTGRWFVPLAGLALAAASVGAQLPAPARAAAPTFVIFGDLVVSKPKGDFANYVDRGFGFNAGVMLQLDTAGMLALRAEIGGLQYGRERMPVSFGSFGGRVTADVVTTNTIGWIALGPQFTFPAGPVRPYGNAAFALTNFRTTSSLEDPRTSEQFAVTENASDFAPAIVFGGGVYVPLGGRAATAMLTLGGRYYNGGEATYLPEGGIEDNADGSVTLHPVRTKTDFVIWQLGVSLPIPSVRR